MKPREQREEKEGQGARDERQSATRRHATEEETDLTGEMLREGQRDKTKWHMYAIETRQKHEQDQLKTEKT